MRRKKAEEKLRWSLSGRFANNADKRLLKEKTADAVVAKHVLEEIWRPLALCDTRRLSALLWSVPTAPVR
jgi:hypothetical protein